jgi:predicted dehydrogenase
MRVVLIGPSHWHYPLYRDGIRRSKVEVVGVMDSCAEWSRKIADEWNCVAWADLHAMLDAVGPDFAFAFGVHAAMPDIADTLIQRRIPFSLEKPGGLTHVDVTRIRRSAESVGLFVSVPFHYRLSGFGSSMRQIVELPSTDFLHWEFRINAGSPLRFRDSSPWLVDPQLAGGGCMMNLAHHAVDFLLQAIGSPVEEVFATASHKFLGLKVEDSAVLELKFADATTATVATGYTHPVSPDSYLEFDFAVSHRDFFAKRDGAALVVRTRETQTKTLMPTDWTFKKYFADYAATTIERVASGGGPVANLLDLEATVEIVQAGYQSIRTKRPVAMRAVSQST